MTIRRLAPLLLYLALAALGLFLLSHLPERVPIHWNLAGEPDRWAAAPVAVLLLPGVGVLTWGIIEGTVALASHLEPETGEALVRFTVVVQGSVALLFALLHGAALAEALGVALPVGVDDLALAAVGALMCALGVYMRFEAGTPDGWRLVNLPVPGPELARRILRGTGVILVLTGVGLALAAALATPAQGVVLLATVLGSAVGIPLYLGIATARGARD